MASSLSASRSDRSFVDFGVEGTSSGVKAGGVVPIRRTENVNRRGLGPKGSVWEIIS